MTFTGAIFLFLLAVLSFWAADIIIDLVFIMFEYVVLILVNFFEGRNK
jgi:hypothetical protein